MIPRPATKRQHSSPAGYGLTKINLSDAVAKITGAPHSGTNPFLNGAVSIPEDANGSMAECLANIRNAQLTIVEEKPLRNPFIQKIEQRQIFSFPENVDNGNNAAEDVLLNVSSEECALIQLDYVDASDKYSDSICADAFESISSPYQKQFRNRSLSAIDATDIDIVSGAENVSAAQLDEPTKNPFVGGNLHKTVSDTQLKHMTSALNRSPGAAQQMWSFGRALGRQANVSDAVIKPTNASQTTVSAEAADSVDLKRAMSCDSVNSDSSVLLADLEQQIVTPSVTGQLCIGLQYDK